jgi:hypothetical protein
MKPDERTATNEPDRTVPKKAYHKPRLEIYGDLTDISQSLNMGMVNDGRAHPNKHFTS